MRSNALTLASVTNASHTVFNGRLPVVESHQYGPVELVLGAVGLWTTGVDERVDGGQDEALLVELLQLARQLAHRRETQRGRPT